MSFGKVFLLMALIVLIGVPMVGYVWETINQLLALEFDVVRIGITIPVVVVLWIFLRFVAGRIRALPTGTGSGQAATKEPVR
ncbi:MAG: hypothetical protein KJO98_08160 [Rhodothermia bacterium]|nr:hypothetical protein [Rhodothermia bacterium]